MGLALGIFELPDRWWPARASSVASRSRGPLQCSDCKSSSPWPRSQLCAYIISPPGRGRVLAPLPPRRPHGYTHRLCVHGSIVISSSYTPVAAPAPRPANLQKSLSRPGCHRVRPTQQLPLSLSRSTTDGTLRPCLLPLQHPRWDRPTVGELGCAFQSSRCPRRPTSSLVCPSFGAFNDPLQHARTTGCEASGLAVQPCPCSVRASGH